VLSDCKSGKDERAVFWLEMMGMFVHIEYYALRDEFNKYLGTLEVVKDITDLRKTVAKVATLQQAAAIGNLTVTEIVNTLRSAVGQQLYDDETSGNEINLSEPDWFEPAKVTVSFDASPIIDNGQNPMQEVFNHLEKLEHGKLFMLTTPFVPAPIIELISKKGYAHYCLKSEQGECRTYFTSTKKNG